MLKACVNECPRTVWHCSLRWMFTIRYDLVMYFLYTKVSNNATLGFFFKLSDRLEGFTRQIWNLPEISGSPASFAISELISLYMCVIHWLMLLHMYVIVLLMFWYKPHKDFEKFCDQIYLTCICKILEFQKGRVYEHKHRYEEAKSCYENALAINPAHTKSLQHLVSG